MGNKIIDGGIAITGDRTVTDAAFNVAISDYTILVDGSSNANTGTLPAGTHGEIHCFKKIDDSGATNRFLLTGSSNIDGAANQTMTGEYANMMVQYITDQWYILNQNNTF